MKKEELFRGLTSFGYPLFKTEKEFDANKLLAEVVKSQDPRLWEGVPLLLATSSSKKLFNDQEVENQLKDENDKRNLHNLLHMSLALYKYLNLGFTWMKNLYDANFFRQKLFDALVKQFKGKEEFSALGNLSSARVVNTFKRYFKAEEPDLEEYTQMKDEFALEYALSQVFSKKQKELFMKKLKGEKMTKTEKEYYSRSVKKKVLALANSGLHRMAQDLSKK